MKIALFFFFFSMGSLVFCIHSRDLLSVTLTYTHGDQGPVAHMVIRRRWPPGTAPHAHSRGSLSFCPQDGPADGFPPASPCSSAREAASPNTEPRNSGILKPPGQTLDSLG